MKSQNISQHNFEQCTKCTVCTTECPVTPVNPRYPGPKQAGPDGERYRLKDPAFFETTLKYCLNCKRCEVACPSGVRIGDIILAARIAHTGSRPSLRDTILAETDIMGSIATKMAPIVNTSLSLTPVKYIMDKVLSIDSHRTFPSYSGTTFESWFKKHAAANQKQFKNHVAYYHGCYVNYNNPALGKAFVEVYNALGLGVHLLQKERCCGVAKISNRLIKEATRDAKTNLVSIRQALAAGANAVLATSSTCCFTIRDEYPHVLGLENSDVRNSVLLATVHLSRLIENGAVLKFKPDFKMRVAYHTPCHLERMGATPYTLNILKAIPGLELTVLPSNCCGISGTYGFKKENYPTSQAIGQPLFDAINAANPQFVVTDCETCRWQIEMSTPHKVQNPIEILASALDLQATAKANA